VELDRDVEGAREPVQVDRTALTQVGRSILVIGHPSGLPTKVAGGGQVRSVLPSHVVTNLDTYGGNSGSGVFDLVNLKLVGILVRGENDFVSAGSCTVSNRCAATGCRGEDVTRLEPVLAHIPDLGGGNDEEDDGEAPPPGPGETVTASANLPIPDADPNGVISSLAVQGEHVGKNLKVAVNISHTWVGDLKLELVAPDGKVVLLQFQKGGRQRDLVGVYGSTLVSQTPLNSLAALSKRGFWKLRVTDTLMRDVGRLNSWGVQIQ
jgi:hypothetical protein